MFEPEIEHFTRIHLLQKNSKSFYKDFDCECRKHVAEQQCEEHLFLWSNLQ